MSSVILLWLVLFFSRAYKEEKDKTKDSNFTGTKRIVSHETPTAMMINMFSFVFRISHNETGKTNKFLGPIF